MGTLNITVIVDRWEGPEDATAGAADKPLTHASTEGSRGRSRGSAQQLDTRRPLHVLDGSLKSLHALSRNDCDLVFNLAVVRRQRHGRLLHRGLPGADREAVHGVGVARSPLRAGQGGREEDLEFHGIHARLRPILLPPGFRDLEFPDRPAGAAEDGSIGIEFNAVVPSIRELMDGSTGSMRTVLRSRSTRRMYAALLGNDNLWLFPLSSWICRSCPRGRPRAGAEVKWAKGTGAYRDAKSIVPDDLSEDGLVADHGACRIRRWSFGTMPDRHAPSPRQPCCRHRSESQSVAVESRVRDGSQGRAHLHGWLKRSSTSRSAGTAGPDLQGRIVPSVFHK